jgi:hypothetical protein
LIPSEKLFLLFFQSAETRINTGLRAYFWLTC